MSRVKKIHRGSGGCVGICYRGGMQEPSVRTSRLAIAGGFAAILVVRGGGFFLGRSTDLARSAERRVGKGCVRSGGSRWWPWHEKHIRHMYSHYIRSDVYQQVVVHRQ